MKNIVVLASAILLLSGCSTIAGNKKPPDALKEIVYYDTQATIGPCPDPNAVRDPAESGIGAILAASFISQGVSKIGEAIKAAGELETKTVLARRNVELKTSKGIGPCVIVVRGWFHKGWPTYELAEEKVVVGDGKVDKVVVTAGHTPFVFNSSSRFPAKDEAGNDSMLYVTRLWDIGLNIAATPDFYFKGQINTSSAKTAYVIQPLEATLDHPISSNILRPSDKRHVLIAMALNDAGSAAELPKGGATMTLGAMQPGEMLTFQNWPCAVSDYAKTLDRGACPPPTEAASYSRVVRSPTESDWFKIESSELVKPMVLQALVTETRSESQFLKFVGAVLGDASKPLAEELQTSLIPSMAESAEAAEQTARENAFKEYESALAKAFSDLAACVKEPADPGKRVTARGSVRAMLISAKKAKGTPSYPGINADTIRPGDSTAKACSDIIDQLK